MEEQGLKRGHKLGDLRGGEGGHACGYGQPCVYMRQLPLATGEQECCKAPPNSLPSVPGGIYIYIYIYTVAKPGGLPNKNAQRRQGNSCHLF